MEIRGELVSWASFREICQFLRIGSAKFEEDLRYELKRVVILMVIKEFSELVEKVKVVERLEPNPRVART
ncbi:hypothetical protein CR513_57128, partial [Mucuna pruriens]